MNDFCDYMHCQWVTHSPRNTQECEFKPRYRQIHSCSDDHLKWQSSIIAFYLQYTSGSSGGGGGLQGVRTPP